MKTIPRLETTRLRLRSFETQDAPRVQELAGAREVACTTLNIPHPYANGMAESWIATHEPLLQENKLVTWAITLRETGDLIGTISLALTMAHQKAEIGYWIGVPYWNHGYCTEAAHAVVEYAFQEMGLNRVVGRHLDSNPASGRVMQKMGMKWEGVLRQDILKWGTYQDIVVYGLLCDEYEALRDAGDHGEAL